MKFPMSKPSILFIGTGNMGNPIAANLLRAGYQLALADLDETKFADLLPLGGVKAQDLIASAKLADVIFLSLPGPAQVEALLFGQGVLAAMKKGAGLIDTTTSSVELARHIGAQAEALGVDYLEAPVTNAIDGAREGRLGIFAAGDKKAFDAYMPIFDVIGEKIFHVGAHGNGATIKLIGEMARKELEEIFGHRIHLFLFVKVREDWAENPEHYEQMGLEFPRDK